MKIQMHTIHGRVRLQDPELGVDPDTGGQVLYVLELARALARLPEVDEVEVGTRLIPGGAGPSYAREEERQGKLVLRRYRAGPDEYIPKERLWPHLPEYVASVQARHEGAPPGVVHGHYGDGGEVGARLAEAWGAPMVFTGHSLGIPKRDRVLAGGMSEEQAESTYCFSSRIAAEERVLREARAIVVSTGEERDVQYSGYEAYGSFHGFHVIPPGIDLSAFRPPGEASETEAARDRQVERKLEASMPEGDRRIILALSRLDPKKNPEGLVKAFGRRPGLQSLAHLVLALGPIDEPGALTGEQQEQLAGLRASIEELGIGRSVTLLARLDYPSEVASLYRVAARSEGVFVNPALHEPFGLTLLEAAASGLPVVATCHGGPVEILEGGESGRLVEPTDSEAMGRVLEELLRDDATRQEIAARLLHRVRTFYGWEASARKHLDLYRGLLENPQ